MSDTKIPLVGEMHLSSGDVQLLRDRLRALPEDGHLKLEEGVTFQFRFKPGPPSIAYNFLPGSKIYRLNSWVPRVRRYVILSNDREYSIRIDESVNGSGGDFWFMGMGERNF